jgi:hypothetical protein
MCFYAAKAGKVLCTARNVLGLLLILNLEETQGDSLAASCRTLSRFS